MRNGTKLGLALVYMVVVGTCFAQNAAEPRFYRLDFVLKELEGGKIINTRAYATIISTGDGTFTVRNGNKVPVLTGGAGNTSQYTYVDVGVNIDCRAAKEIQEQLALNVTAETSGAVMEPSGANQPSFRQAKWSSNVIVPLRKPTTIFSSDDPSSKRQTQLELTATPIR